jgi:hypothetical protein
VVVDGGQLGDIEGECIARAVDPQFRLNARHRGSLTEDITVSPAGRRGDGRRGGRFRGRVEVEPTALVAALLIVVSPIPAMTLALCRGRNSFAAQLMVLVRSRDDPMRGSGRSVGPACAFVSQQRGTSRIDCGHVHPTGGS